MPPPLRSRLLGTGAALPDGVVDSASVEQRLGLETGWVKARSGIEQRPIAANAAALPDLAEAAARAALAMAGVAPTELDGILFGTTSTHELIPTVACQVQQRLGSAPCFAVDLAAACSGFLYGLGFADGLLRTGQARTLLVMGGDVYSQVCDPADRICSPLFGDGVGAAVLRAEAGERGLLRVIMQARGNRIVELPAGPLPRPSGQALRMQGAELFRMAVTELLKVTRQVMADCGVTAADVKLLVPHQANIRMIQAMTEHLGFTPEQVFCHIQTHGNLSAGSLPVALDTAWRAGMIEAGDLVLLNAVGGGVTWGAAAVRL
jgi:3-oxoacyl-[acyl-carrier-protein] synthase III